MVFEFDNGKLLIEESDDGFLISLQAKHLGSNKITSASLLIDDEQMEDIVKAVQEKLIKRHAD